MKLLKLKSLLFLFTTLFFIYSCSNDDTILLEESIAESILLIDEEIDVEVQYHDNQGPHEHNFSTERASGFTEGFDAGKKNSYAAQSVNLSSGTWNLTDALIGDLPNDRKFGSKSARIRNGGYALMLFNMDNGVTTVRVRHAKYGSDGNSSWRLIASYNNGNSWSYAGGTINTTSTTLNTVTFNVNETRAVRYGIYKTSGGSNRINIDNIEINTAAGGGNPATATRDSNLTFGNPSNASRSSSNNYFLSRNDYTLAYNNSRGIANWVSWHLSTAWTGSTPRCNCFKEDALLPANFFSPNTNDYVGSGFDRGHICPSADRTRTSNSNENTFFMTNMAPQAPDNNQRTWVGLENYCRDLIKQGNELYILAGGVGNGGTGRNGFRSTIDNGNIAVPDSFWKVILVLPNGTNDINRVTTSTRVIAVNIPNDQGISNDWTDFRTSINTIENLTGYDFFENIPNSIEAVIESRVDNTAIN